MRLAIAVVLIFASIQSLDGIPNSRLNFFDTDLLRYSAEDKNGNVMVSPASIKSMLAMLLEGAVGDTAAEIRRALRLSPMKEDFREELSLYMRALQANTAGVSLLNANGLFVSNKLQLKRDYERMARNIYFSDLSKVDFNNPKVAANAINDWVKTKTRNLIPTIVDDVHVSPSTELLVTNALYFKSSWLHQFEPSLTHGDCFYKDNVCKTVAMMDLQAELDYAYVENLRAHALELPYQGGRYSMILLVPQDRDAGVALIRDLPYVGLWEIYDQMEPTNVILTMPRFTVEYSDDMIAALKNMRITTLFSPSANLSGIIEGTSAYLNSIYHTVYMSVDEKGTVAAAASAAMVIPLIDDQVQLRVDRPFLFFIKDNDLGLVLFEGKIEEPTEFTELNNRQGQDQIRKPLPISTLSQSSLNQPIQKQPTSSQTVPIQPLPILPIVSRPVSSQPISSQPTSSQATSSQPIQSQTTPDQPYTSSPSRKSENSWYQKISGYFG